MKKKILLVDDVRLFLQLEETFFRRTGCEILTAGSGKEALEQAEKHRPDLILLDYLMPDMMGDEVASSIRCQEWGKKTPIIVVSTSADKQNIQRCFQAGCNDYVTKPINPHEVLAKSANALGIPNRVHYRIIVNFKVEGHVSNQTFTGFSRNISRGGILVECSHNLDLGSRLVMDLPVLPEAGMLNVKGEVVRKDFDESKEKYLLGIKFVDVDEDSQSLIDSFIEAKKPLDWE